MLPTASSLETFLACQYWAREGAHLIHDPSGDAAQFGTAVHEAIEREATGQAPAPVPDGVDAEKLARVVAAWREWWPSQSGLEWRHESPLAFDVATGESRRLPSDGHRDYNAAKATEIVGTADLVAHDEDAAIVGDYKTGRVRNVTPAARNAQLAFLALAETRRTGATRARVFLAFVHESGVTVDAAELDELDLVVFADVLAEKVAGIETSTPQPGPHCRYCRHRHACSAQAGAAAPLDEPSNGNALALLDGTAALSVDQVARAHVALRIVEDRVAAAKKRIRSEVERLGVVPIGNGKALKIVDATRENVSKASISKALGKADGAALLDKLRECGALTVTTFSTMQEIKQ